MNHKLFITLIVLVSQIHAQIISLSDTEEKNWNIKVENPIRSPLLPIGEYVAEVTASPSSLQTVSLPFRVSIQQVYVAEFQQVKKGDTLVSVTGSAWIDAQQKAIEDHIAYQENLLTSKRQQKLCTEGVIPKKECIMAEAKLELLGLKKRASKALLESYGATPEMLENLYKSFKLSQKLDIVSQYHGTVKSLNASPGKMIGSTEPLMVIQQSGNQWLESHINMEDALQLQPGKEIQIKFSGKTFSSKVLQISSIVNAQNNTLSTRLLVPENLKFYVGMRTNVQIVLKTETLKVPKNAVIYIERKATVFVKKPKGYMPVIVNVDGEDEKYYYISGAIDDQTPIAVTSLAIFKNLSGGDDE